MKIWQLYAILGILFGGVVGSGVVNFAAQEKMKAQFTETVTEGGSVPQEEVAGESVQTLPDVKGESAQKIATFSAQAVVLGDIETGEVFAAKNAQKPLPIASLTKIMTAAVVSDRLSLETPLTVSSKCSQMPLANQQLGLKESLKISVEDLLYGLMVRSGADCACVLAESLGGEEELVALMNQKALALNLTGTHFQNSVGNDTIDNFSTAGDLFKLTRLMMANPVFRKIVGTNYFWGQPNTNQLLFEFAGITGVKTGSTPGAGECLAASWVEGGREFLGVILSSQDRFGEVGKLIELSQSL